MIITLILTLFDDDLNKIHAGLVVRQKEGDVMSFLDCVHLFYLACDAGMNGEQSTEYVNQRLRMFNAARLT